MPSKKTSQETVILSIQSVDAAIFRKVYFFIFQNTESSFRNLILFESKNFIAVVNALQRQNTEISKQIFPEKEYRGLSPNFHIHASVSDLYIPTYKSLTDT
jgi:hypothetical protein